MKPRRVMPLVFLLVCSLGAWAQSKSKPTTEPEAKPSAILMQTLQQELARASTALAKADPAPYFISFAADDRQALVMAASQGALLASTPQRSRRQGMLLTEIHADGIEVRQNAEHVRVDHRAQLVGARARPVRDGS